MSHADPRSPLHAVRNRAQALEAWQSATRLVWTRWEAFREAETEARAGAFAAYVAALDAEAAAADQLAASPLVVGA